MPHDPIEITRTIEERSDFGSHDAIVKRQYVPPADSNTGGFEHDPFRAADQALADKVYVFLKTRFPVGYEWFAEANIAQGIVRFNIPVLMGFRIWYVINLHKTPLDKGILQGAGEILERYCQSRTRFQLGSFLEARERHSKLVMPCRPIPT